MSVELKPTEAKPVEKTPAEKTAEQTVSEVIGTQAPEAPKPTEAQEMVPLSSLLEFKKETKELKKTIKDLEKKIESGDITSKDDVDAEVEALAKEHDVDPKFAKSLARILGKRAESAASESIKPMLENTAKLSKKERDDEIDRRFKAAFTKEMEAAPEFKDIANADVIKALSLLPENGKKTFRQLIEDTYGKAISGKRTIEGTKPAGGKDPEPIDFARAKQDSEYFKEIMADPAKKAEYNKNLLAPRHRR